jgi:hypothetical protein
MLQLAARNVLVMMLLGVVLIALLSGFVVLVFEMPLVV